MIELTDGSVVLTREEARQLLDLMGFERDYNIASNEAEYYLKPTHPMASFHVPKHRDLSEAHSRKLLELYKKFMGNNN